MVTVAEKLKKDPNYLKYTPEKGKAAREKAKEVLAKRKTKVSVVSDAKDDQGKKFGDEKIQSPKQYKKSRSSSSSSSFSKRKTKVSVVSDAKEDQGKKFGDEKIQSPKQYEDQQEISRAKKTGRLQSTTTESQEKKIKETIERIKQTQRQENEKINQKSINNYNRSDSGFFNSGYASNNPKSNISRSIRNRNINDENNGGFVLANSNTSNLPGNSALQQQRTITDKERVEGYDAQGNPIIKKGEEYWDKTVDTLNKPRNWLFGKVEEGADYLSEKAENIDKKQLRRTATEPAKAALYRKGSLVLNVVNAPNKFIFEPLYKLTRDPAKTSKEFAITTGVTVAYAATQPGSFKRDVQKSAVSAAQKARRGDPETWANVLATAAAPVAEAKVIDKTLDAAAAARTAVKLRGKPEVDPEDVFSKQVTEGGETLPKAKSAQEAVEQFQKTDSVSTASPSKIEGDTAGGGRKGSVGLEDPGIYVTPKGEASPYFLRTSGYAKRKKFTLNPKKIYESAKAKFQTPTVTELKTTGVVEPSQKALDTPGFSGVRKQQEELVGRGKAQITKRSKIGQGEAKRQQFPAEEDFETPVPLTVVRDGKTTKVPKDGKIQKGDLITEAGTTELEAVIPAGSKFTDEGIVGFTRWDGKKVAIRRGDLVVDRANNQRMRNIGEAKTSMKPTIIKEQRMARLEEIKRTGKRPKPQRTRTISDLKKEQKQLYDSFGPNRVEYSPPPGIGLVSSALSGMSGGGQKPRGFSMGGSSRGGSSGTVSPVGGSSGGSSGGGSSGGSSGGGSISNVLGGSSIRLPGPSSSSQSKKTPAFDVYAKEKGKRIKINEKPIPRNLAMKKGSNVVDKTTSASYEIVKRGFTKMSDIPKFNNNKFRQRRTKDALEFVEKSKYRMDTRGEKQGLKINKFLKRFKL